jgi:hypothetical protein
VVQLLLQSVGEVVLFAEEDYSTFRDYSALSWGSTTKPWCEHTGDSKVTDKLISVGSVQKIIDNVDVQKLATNNGSCLLIAKLFKCTGLLERVGKRGLIGRRHRVFELWIELDSELESNVYHLRRRHTHYISLTVCNVRWMLDAVP